MLDASRAPDASQLKGERVSVSEQLHELIGFALVNALLVAGIFKVRVAVGCVQLLDQQFDRPFDNRPPKEGQRRGHSLGSRIG